jgi:hypothetical protein
MRGPAPSQSHILSPNTVEIRFSALFYVADLIDISSLRWQKLSEFAEAYRIGKKVMKKSLTSAGAYQYKQLAQNFFAVTK